MEVEKIVGILIAVLGGGGLFAWLYGPRREKANAKRVEAEAEKAEAETGLKQLELMQGYMETIKKLSNEIDAGLVTSSYLQRELTVLREKYVALKRLAQKLYEAVKEKVKLNDDELELLRSGSTADLYKPMKNFDKDAK